MEDAFSKVCEVFEDSIKFVVEKEKAIYVNLQMAFGKLLIYQALPIVSLKCYVFVCAVHL